jgi:hypothetical protein
MSSWGWRVAEDWDAQEYDTQQTYKKQARKEHRIVKALAQAKVGELKETVQRRARWVFGIRTVTMTRMK